MTRAPMGVNTLNVVILTSGIGQSHPFQNTEKPCFVPYVDLPVAPGGDLCAAQQVYIG